MISFVSLSELYHFIEFNTVDAFQDIKINVS